MEVMYAIIEADARDACKEASDVTERLKAAMRVAHDHWMVTNPEEQFKGAVYAALVHSSEEDCALIEESLKPMKMLAAAASGVPVDFSSLEGMDMKKLIPLRKLWDETAAP